MKRMTEEAQDDIREERSRDAGTFIAPGRAPRVEIRTIPAPRVDLPAVPEVSLCDTCTGVPVVVAYELSERIVMFSGDTIVHSHEHRWLACRLCEILIDAREVDGLIERARSASRFPDPDDLLGRLNATVMQLIASKTEIKR